MSKKKTEESDCPRCNAFHYSCLGFTFPGDETLELLVNILASHPEYAKYLEGEGWEN